MRLVTTIEIATNAKAAWHVLGKEFGNIAQWTTSLKSSSLEGELGVGAVRTCSGVGFGPFPPGAVSEKLIEFDPQNYRLTYKGERGLPWFIRHAQNTWSILEKDAQCCVVSSHATVKLNIWLKPFSWLLPWLLKRDMRTFVEELKYRIENNKPHPRKIKALAGAN